jgi:hypothetical protein
MTSKIGAMMGLLEWKKVKRKASEELGREDNKTEKHSVRSNIWLPSELTLSTLQLVVTVGDGKYLWDGGLGSHVLESQEVERPRRGSKAVAALGISQKRARKLLESVVAVHNWASSTFDIKIPEVLKGIQVLIPFLGLDGTATAADLISCHNTRLRTRIHEEGEKFMSLYTRQREISLTNNDKVALVLATAYANSVDLFKDNTRAIAIAKAYMSAYMKYADEPDKKKRRQLIDRKVLKSKPALEPDTVRLYHRFGSNDRQKTDAMLFLRNHVLDDYFFNPPNVMPSPKCLSREEFDLGAMSKPIITQTEAGASVAKPMEVDDTTVCEPTSGGCTEISGGSCGGKEILGFEEENEGETEKNIIIE